MDEAYNIDLDMLMSLSDDLLKCLKDMKDINSLALCCKQSETLQSSCDSSYRESLSLIEVYQKRIVVCKQHPEQTKSEVVDDSEISSLERDLADAEKREQLFGEELRGIVDEITELEEQRISVEQQKKKLQKMGQDEKRAAAMLSFYASVTNIIPDLTAKFKIAGLIVDRETKAVQRFEMVAGNQTAFDTCNKLWNSIDTCKLCN